MRYAYLDGLRGIAILGVIATHSVQGVRGLPQALEGAMTWGIRGVHLFFIVSSLTLMLVTRLDQFSYKNFALRRYFRIAPMFYVAAVFYSIMFLSDLIEVSYKPTGLDIAATMLFVHGFNPFGINNVVPGGWSIACEAIFYFLFCAGLMRVRSIKSAMGLLLLAFIAVTLGLLLRFAFREYMTDGRIAEFLHFNFLMNCVPFASGILIYNIISKEELSNKLVPYASYLKPVIFLLIVIYGMLFHSSLLYEVPFSIILATFTMFVALKPGPIIQSRLMCFLGEISFSVYLIHFVVVDFASRFTQEWSSPSGRLVVIYTITLLASAFLAALTYNYIEKPMIRFGRMITG